VVDEGGGRDWVEGSDIGMPTWPHPRSRHRARTFAAPCNASSEATVSHIKWSLTESQVRALRENFSTVQGARSAPRRLRHACEAPREVGTWPGATLNCPYAVEVLSAPAIDLGVGRRANQLFSISAAFKPGCALST
jgi:hypothetical protein